MSPGIITPSATELQQGRAATPIAFIRAILAAYRQYGIDPASALAAAQIDPALLDDDTACVTAAQMESLSGTAMQALDDEALGWFSRRLPWGSYGMLCRASLTAPNLAVALKRWCRHHRLLSEELTLHFSERDGEALIELREHRSLGELREFCLVSILRYLIGYACWLVDSHISFKAITLPFAAPAHAQAYAYLFAGPVQFDAAAASLRFDARYLTLPVRRDEAALQSMLQRALPLTVLQYRRDRLLVHRVQQFLAAEPARAHTAEELAAALNLSVRTLHRQLRDEGVSLQKLKNAVRHAEALRLLLHTSKPVKQIAAAVGFDSEKSFARAFRSWQGDSPVSVRQEGRQRSRSAAAKEGR